VAQLNRGRVSDPAQAALSGSHNEAPGSAGGNLTDPDRHQVLNGAIGAGGEPVGLIAVDKAANQITLRASVYLENADWEEQAQMYLHTLFGQISRLAGSPDN